MTPRTFATHRQLSAIRRAGSLIQKWLAPSGITLGILKEDLGDGILGEYEAGSVFTGEITVRVNPPSIRTSCSFLPFPEDIQRQTRLTVYHEVGHALLEQIIDWDEFYEDMDETISRVDKVYTDVFDDSVDEETLVEDFAYGFEYGHGSQLQGCWEALTHC